MQSGKTVNSLKPRSLQEFRFRLPGKTDNLELIREFVSKIAEKFGFNNESVFDIIVAVDEACTNVIEHAYPSVKGRKLNIKIEVTPSGIIISIFDKGRGFNPQLVDSFNLKEKLTKRIPGGLGLYLIHSLMDEVYCFINPGKKNEVRMVKYY